MLDRCARGCRRGGLAQNIKSWEDRLTTITVKTPEPTFDLMGTGGHIPGAVRGCGRGRRFTNRRGFGFRDQLQDVMLRVCGSGGGTRATSAGGGEAVHRRRCAHWWHPTERAWCQNPILGRPGVAPYVVDTTCHYHRRQRDPRGEVPVHRDAPAQSRRARGLWTRLSPRLNREASTTTGVRALRRRALRASRLATDRSGDWNDGMNRVGIEGKGESVWLAWFSSLRSEIRAARGEARGLGARERAAADGGGYVTGRREIGLGRRLVPRAYFDDGSPLGSRTANECKIDSLPRAGA